MLKVGKIQAEDPGQRREVARPLGFFALQLRDMSLSDVLGPGQVKPLREFSLRPAPRGPPFGYSFPNAHCG
jgi:hypothetical protein